MRRSGSEQPSKLIIRSPAGLRPQPRSPPSRRSVSAPGNPRSSSEIVTVANARRVPSDRSAIAPARVLRAARRSDQERALSLFAALKIAYPDAHCELNYRNPHELLVATILSAQATDVSVNKVTPALFERFPTPAAYAASSPAEIEASIRSIGLFRNKARAIHEAMTTVMNRFGGRVPNSMAELLTLRGVARKTANVVLSNAFGINEGVVVDTHVARLAVRLGLAPSGTPVAKIERRLMDLLPREDWGLASHLLIWHGRRACKARLPCCADHPICHQFGRRCELRSTRGA
ncbi:MAG: endonuclease III [Phycisphaerae bacterium]|nr:endonuclease III [Phycisphaerae bacterium]